MSGRDPYGGGTIPRDALSYFNTDSTSSPQQSRPHQSDPYKTSRISPAKAGRYSGASSSIGDLDDLEDYSVRTYGRQSRSSPQYDSSSRGRRNDDLQRHRGPAFAFNPSRTAQSPDDDDFEDDIPNYPLSDPRQKEQEELLNENLAKLRERMERPGNNNSKQQQQLTRRNPSSSSFSRNPNTGPDANSESRFNNPNRRYPRSEQNIKDREFEHNLKDQQRSNYNPFEADGSLRDDPPKQSMKGTKSNRFSNKTLEDVTKEMKPGTIFGRDLDTRTPQIGLFAKNKDLEKHLFQSDRSQGPLFLPYDENMQNFDADFEAKDGVYKEALAEGYFDERHLEGQEDIASWGINPPKKNFRDDDNVSTPSRSKPLPNPRNVFKFDGSEFEQDESELDALYAQLQHINSTPPPSSNDGMLAALKRGETDAWTGYRVPKLSELGLNPADAGYTDKEVNELFGEMQFIDGKISRGEPLTPEEEEFALPFTEDELLDRMSRIEAKAEYKVKKMTQLENRARKRRSHLVLNAMATAVPKARHRVLFESKSPQYVRILTQTPEELHNPFDPLHETATYDYNFDPSMNRLGDSEVMDRSNYYRRYYNSNIQPLAFVLSGDLDDAIGMFCLFPFIVLSCLVCQLVFTISRLFPPYSLLIPLLIPLPPHPIPFLLLL